MTTPAEPQPVLVPRSGRRPGTASSTVRSRRNRRLTFLHYTSEAVVAIG